LTAIRREKPDDYALRFVSIIGLSVPTFWVGTMAIVLPSIWWSWTPPLFYKGLTDDFQANIGMMILPAIILALPVLHI